jgi:hypothetical protein
VEATGAEAGALAVSAAWGALVVSAGPFEHAARVSAEQSRAGRNFDRWVFMSNDVL